MLRCVSTPSYPLVWSQLLYAAMHGNNARKLNEETPNNGNNMRVYSKKGASFICLRLYINKFHMLTCYCYKHLYISIYNINTNINISINIDLTTPREINRVFAKIQKKIETAFWDLKMDIIEKLRKPVSNSLHTRHKLPHEWKDTSTCALVT